MEKITKARAALLLSEPFYGSLALHLRVVEDPAIETMETDGVSLFASPDFVRSLSYDELKGVLAHEVTHLACSHHARRGARDPELWNVACDYAINGVLLKSGFVLPEGRLYEPRFDDMSAEQIYALLQQERQEGDDGSNSRPDTGAGSGGNGSNDPGNSSSPGASTGDPGGCGGVRDAPATDGGQATSAELRQAEKRWQVAALQAAQVAKAMGKLPGDVAHLIEEARSPAVDWRDVLRRFVQSSARNDYRWFPPNRRYVPMGLYLPSLRSEEMGPIVIAVDTSGSLSEPLLDQFAAEVSAILEDCRPEAIHVIYCDAEIAGAETFHADDLPLDLKAVGGGGTDFRPPFTWVKEQGLSPACLVYLTDLCSSRFPETPDYPVLWAATTDRSAPFGETVRIPLA